MGLCRLGHRNDGVDHDADQAGFEQRKDIAGDPRDDRGLLLDRPSTQHRRGDAGPSGHQRSEVEQSGGGVAPDDRQVSVWREALDVAPEIA